MTNLNKVAKQLEQVAINTAKPLAVEIERKRPERDFFIMNTTNITYDIGPEEGYTKLIHFFSMVYIPNAVVGNRGVLISYYPGDRGGVDIQPTFWSHNIVASSSAWITFGNHDAAYISTGTSFGTLTAAYYPLPVVPCELWPGDTLHVGLVGPDAGDHAHCMVQYEKRRIGP